MDDQQHPPRRTATSVNVISARSQLSRLVPDRTATIAADATVAEAVRQMETAGVSALLIDGSTAIITERDIARGLGHGAPLDSPVGPLATPQPVVAPASTTVLEACTLMLERHVRHLVVNVDGRAGVVSIRDVLAVLLQDADPQLWYTALRVAINVPSELFLG